MEYPQYRKLSNEKTFYKITSDRSFEEKQLMGSKVLFHTNIAEQYPEIIRIQDMLHLSESIYLLSDESEWDNY